MPAVALHDVIVGDRIRIISGITGRDAKRFQPWWTVLDVREPTGSRGQPLRGATNRILLLGMVGRDGNRQTRQVRLTPSAVILKWEERGDG